MKKNARILILMLAVFGLGVLLCACGGDKSADSDGDGGGFFSGGEKIVCPLDGLEIDSEDDHGDYVIAVSIDNGADSEPQSGIAAADLLVEVPVEGGINRFLAVFYHRTPDTIGPVRSARHYMYDITTGFDAPLAHCGGSPKAYEIARSGAVKDMDEMGCPDTFWRDSSRRAPHNLYTSYENLSAKSAERNYNKIALEDCPSFAFLSDEEVDDLSFGGTDELTVPYRYKEISYHWDDENENYQRYSGGHPHMDAAADAVVTADNIAVLYVPNHPLDNEGRLDMVIESGEGLILQYGNVIKINWTLADGEGFTFTDAESGEAVKLIPGKTIIQIASPETQAEYSLAATETEEDD